MHRSNGKDPPSVAVIGGGWYGCHIALELKNKGFRVVLLEKSDSLFNGASGKNQFRLHAGFHYPRSNATRFQITEGLREFKYRLSHFAHPLQTCLYAISSTASFLDFGTFKQIFKATGVPFADVYAQNYGLTNVEGCIHTDEEMFLFVDAPKEFYKDSLGDSVRLKTTVSKVKNTIDADRNNVVSVDGTNFDWCINCTYNQLNPVNSTDYYFEVCLTLIYKKITPGRHITGITIMDGEFCSLYPYVLDKNDLERDSPRYTLTHVRYTPLMKTKTLLEAEQFMQRVSDEDVEKQRPFFEAGISHFYPAFSIEFEFDSWFVSMKTKPIDSGAANHTASRECIAERDGKVIRVLSGKINTLFEAERLVMAEVLRDWSTQNNS